CAAGHSGAGAAHSAGVALPVAAGRAAWPSGRDSARWRTAAPSRWGDALDQGALRGAATDRDVGEACEHERLGTARSLQGGRGGEPDPVPEAPPTAGGSPPADV